MADLFEAQDNYTKAAAALQSALTLAPDDQERLKINVARSRLMIRSGFLEEGISLYKESVVKMTSSNEASRKQLELGQLLLDERHYKQAAREFQHYLEAFQAV